MSFSTFLISNPCRLKFIIGIPKETPRQMYPPEKHAKKKTHENINLGNFKIQSPA